MIQENCAFVYHPTQVRTPSPLSLPEADCPLLHHLLFYSLPTGTLSPLRLALVFCFYPSPPHKTSYLSLGNGLAPQRTSSTRKIVDPHSSVPIIIPSDAFIWVINEEEV